MFMYSFARNIIALVSIGSRMSKLSMFTYSQYVAFTLLALLHTGMSEITFSNNKYNNMVVSVDANVPPTDTDYNYPSVLIDRIKVRSRFCTHYFSDT